MSHRAAIDMSLLFTIWKTRSPFVVSNAGWSVGV